jgi:Flp pilus assembly protein TadB
MRKYFSVAAIFAVCFTTIGVAVAFFSVRSADAFTGNAGSIAKAATTTNSIIEVKHSPHKSRPPGWSHGRKVGWHGRGKPPGQL